MVTDLPTDEAVDMLLNGPGFVLYSNLYGEADLKAAKEELLRRVYEADSDAIDAKGLDDVGHNNIYKNS